MHGLLSDHQDRITVQTVTPPQLKVLVLSFQSIFASAAFRVPKLKVWAIERMSAGACFWATSILR